MNYFPKLYLRINNFYFRDEKEIIYDHYFHENYFFGDPVHK